MAKCMSGKHPSLRWRGLTKEGSLLLHVPDDSLPPPHDPSLLLEGEVLIRKREHHVTVMNRAWGSAARDILGQDRLEALFHQRQWRIEGWGDLFLIHKPANPVAGESAAWSIIQLIDLPAMQAYIDDIVDSAGLDPRTTVPHITRYVAHAEEGIGVPDRETLDRRLVRQFVPS